MPLPLHLVAQTPASQPEKVVMMIIMVVVVIIIMVMIKMMKQLAEMMKILQGVDLQGPVTANDHGGCTYPVPGLSFTYFQSKGPAQCLMLNVCRAQWSGCRH